MAKTAYLFPAAGGLRPGNAEFLRDFHVKPFEAASRLVDYDLAKVCREGPQEMINHAAVSNVGVFAQSVDTAALLLYKIVPDAIVGYSVGQYAALHTAGFFPFEKGVHFLHDTGMHYQEAFSDEKYGMAIAVTRDLDKLEQACKKVRTDGIEIYVSNINAPGIYMISGERAAFPLVSGQIEGRIRDTNVNVPSHSPIVRKVETGLHGYLNRLLRDERRPCLPCLSTMANIYLTKDNVRGNLAHQLSSRINWIETVENLLNEGIDRFIEVGPGHALTDFVKRICAVKGVAVETYATDKGERMQEVLDLATAENEAGVKTANMKP